MGVVELEDGTLIRIAVPFKGPFFIFESNYYFRQEDENLYQDYKNEYMRITKNIFIPKRIENEN